MIRTLNEKNVDWAIVADNTLDNREDRRFSATHKLVWSYLMKNFESVRLACLTGSMKLLHRKHRSNSPATASR